MTAIRSPADIGQALRSGREARGLTQTQLAKLIKTDNKTICRREQPRAWAHLTGFLAELAALGLVLMVVRKDELPPEE